MALDLPPNPVCQLFKVTVAMPVFAETYYVAADGYEDARRLVIAKESAGELKCGGVTAMELLAVFGDGGELLVSKRVAKPLGFLDPSTL